MKKFPNIEMKIEEKDELPEKEPEPEPELPKIKTKPEDIFIKKVEKPTAKASKASEKQLAHLETIRAKALLARQNKKKQKVEDTSPEPTEPPPPLPDPPPPVVKVKDASKPPSLGGETPEPPKPSPTLYTKEQLDDYVKSSLIGFHEKERDKRIAEVRKKQAELEEQRKKYDVSSLLKKGGRNRMW